MGASLKMNQLSVPIIKLNPGTGGQQGWSQRGQRDKLLCVLPNYNRQWPQTPSQEVQVGH